MTGNFFTDEEFFQGDGEHDGELFQDGEHDGEIFTDRELFQGDGEHDGELFQDGEHDGDMIFLVRAWALFLWMGKTGTFSGGHDRKL